MGRAVYARVSPDTPPAHTAAQAPRGTVDRVAVSHCTDGTAALQTSVQRRGDGTRPTRRR